MTKREQSAIMILLHDLKEHIVENKNALIIHMKEEQGTLDKIHNKIDSSTDTVSKKADRQLLFQLVAAFVVGFIAVVGWLGMHEKEDLEAQHALELRMKDIPAEVVKQLETSYNINP